MLAIVHRKASSEASVFGRYWKWDIRLEGPWSDSLHQFPFCFTILLPWIMHLEADLLVVWDEKTPPCFHGPFGKNTLEESL